MSSLRRTSSHNGGNNNNDPGREGPRCSPDNGGAGSHSTRSTDGGITQIPFAVSNGCGDDNAGISSSGGGDGVAGEGGNLVSARGELSSGVSNQNSGSSDSPGHVNNICGELYWSFSYRINFIVPSSHHFFVVIFAFLIVCIFAE